MKLILGTVLGLALVWGVSVAKILPVKEAPKLQRIAILYLYTGIHGHLLYNDASEKCQWNIHAPEAQGNILLEVVPVECPDDLDAVFKKLSI